MHRAAAIILCTLVAAPAFGQVVDHPISGAKLLLKASSSGKQKLVFQSKDPSFPFPERFSFDDPTEMGPVTIEILTPGVPAGTEFEAPPNSEQPGWTYKRGAARSYKYKRDKTLVSTTTIKGITLKEGRALTVIGDAAGIPLDGARGTVGIRITFGLYTKQRACARFSGVAVAKDAPGAFVGKNATTSGLTDCELTTLTGAAPVCGDGEVNQESEGCDGAAACEIDSLECRPPGAPGECGCCSDGYPSAAPCCNPSSIAIYYPPMDKTCIPTGCTPPYTCRGGDECRSDETCCSTNGGNYCMQAYAPPFINTMVSSVTCCAGLECSRPAFPLGVVCCGSAGTACGGDGECCTGHCQSGTCEACRSGGAACGNPAECCSGSCTSGVCDVCATAGTLCSSDAQCCSGTCSGLMCQ